MARNLVPVQPQPELAVLDHQDLRLGPATYDIASLLNDSLFPPDELEESIVRARLPTAEERLEYHRAAAQRTLKAVGTFVGFARGGNSRHLPLVVPTLTRARAHLRRLPELEGSSGEVDTLWNDLRGALAARFGRDRIC